MHIRSLSFLCHLLAINCYVYSCTAMDGKQYCTLFASFVIIFFFFFRLFSITPLVHAQVLSDTATANLSTLWSNTCPDGSRTNIPLLRMWGRALKIECGFFCSSKTTTSCDAFLFGIYVIVYDPDAYLDGMDTAVPQVVWSANRNRPVRENAILQLTAEGDLVLKDVDGTVVWSTNTSGESVVAMRLLESGNLVLSGKDDKPVWQSFDHPTDTLLLGQELVEGRRLTANASESESSEGKLYLSATHDGWEASANASPPQVYYRLRSGRRRGVDKNLVSFKNGTVVFSHAKDQTIQLPLSPFVQYMRLEFDGRLGLYQWNSTDGWKRVQDVFSIPGGDCSCPTVCGNYGVCNSTGQCSCPQNVSGNEIYLKPVDDRELNLGCSLITPLSCQSRHDHKFLDLENVSYFNYVDERAVISYLKTANSCKEACMVSCSCKAAIFQYGSNVSDGRCYLPSEIFSLMNNPKETSNYSSTVYLKVQVPRASPTPYAKIVGAALGCLLGLVLISLTVIALLRKIRGKQEEEDDPFDQLTGMPTRFSYEQLKKATNNFLTKLGGGGFGSVFQGTLVDGTRVAVKQIENVALGKMEFLLEVQKIGNIHHVNLVRLVGFCAEKSHRLLVYEYMCNGSLDKWIFQGDQNHEFNWKTRCKVINQVAKGLLHLHQECRQITAHLGIKPQNILLDENFDAKVSNFGLSKPLSRDQICVMTRLTRTPEYLAPELTTMVTEKADVYSFGVVIVEILCGKRLDHSQPERSDHLLSVLLDMANERQIFNFVENYCQNMEINEKEAAHMLHLAIWCLQRDASKRPPMSAVVSVLQGTLGVDRNLDYNFWSPMHRADEVKHADLSAVTPFLGSVMPGPR